MQSLQKNNLKNTKTKYISKQSTYTANNALAAPGA
jgi:hypothetical protein